MAVPVAEGARRPDAARGEGSRRRVRDRLGRRTDLPAQAAVVGDGGLHRVEHEAAGHPGCEGRLGDLDKEGVWGEVVFPSLGMWGSTFRTPELLKACMRASNEWALEEICAVSPRYVVTAQVSTLTSRTRSRNCRGGGQRLQSGVPADDTAPECAGLAPQRVGAVLGGRRRSRHGDRVPHRHRPGRHDGRARAGAGMVYRGPGGALLNYTETTFGGQRAAMKLVASGALDRHPDLKVLISEGGATWVPFLADRMEEGYRQHHMAVRPKLNRVPRRSSTGRCTRRSSTTRPRSPPTSHGLPERDVGQRLPAHGRHLRAHPGDAEGAVRRRQRRDPAAHHPGHVQRTVPRRAAHPCRTC